MQEPPSFFWHDYETFGVDPCRDWPVQFAGQRTGSDLEPIEEPVLLYCKPQRDQLPHPQACLLTGITPILAERHGAPPAEFASVIHEELSRPNTCSVGYNTIRFDDHVTRHLFYRNFFDPYAREWENGNSRWDIIDLARLCYALRPNGVEWPLVEQNRPSFRLQDLATANHLESARAHDALSDVNTTIALARLLRLSQPKLFEYYYGLRQKRNALELLDWQRRTMVLHASSRYAANRGCIAAVLPIAPHPIHRQAVIVYDLAEDPEDLLRLDAQAIQERVFTARADLPENQDRIALKLVYANRSPALAPLGALKDVNLERIGLDLERARVHCERINRDNGLAEKIKQVFSFDYGNAPQDAECALYAMPFLDSTERELLKRVRGAPQDAEQTCARFKHAHYLTLLSRYRARNWPDAISTGQKQAWSEHCREQLTSATPHCGLSWRSYHETIAAHRLSPQITGKELIILDELLAWSAQLANELGLNPGA